MMRSAPAEAPMPYKSRAERESENWMTLPQASAHIKSVNGLDDERKARAELLKALTDNAFYSHRRYLIRWKDEVCISGPPPNEIGPRDVPPRGQEWAQAKIRWASGKVLDRYGGAKNGKWEPAWRIVWLTRSKVMKLWPGSSKPFLPPTAPTSSASDNVVRFRTRGRTPAISKKIEDAMRKDVQNGQLTIQELNDMKEVGLEERYKASRDTCRKVRKKVILESKIVENSSDRISDK
jgi:hypothetical protein